MARSRSRRGATLINVVIGVGLGLVAISAIAVLSQRNRGCSRTGKDANYVQQLHKSFLMYAGDEPGGELPIPSHIARRTATDGSPERSGAELNTTAHLYSALLAQRYFNTDLLIAPTEINPQVAEKVGYDMAAFQPQEGRYWDETFRMDLHLANGQAHASYAHLALCGERLTAHWRRTADARAPILGSRGTYRGTTSGERYHRSFTLPMHGSPTAWEGNIAYADNHTEFLSTFSPEALTWDCGAGDARADNIFDCEFSASDCPKATGDPRSAGDRWLCIGVGMTTDSEPLVIDADERLIQTAR